MTSEPFAKQSFRPNSVLCSKFYPRNINHMPVVKFLAWFDFERKNCFAKGSDDNKIERYQKALIHNDNTS